MCPTLARMGLRDVLYLQDELNIVVPSTWVPYHSCGARSGGSIDDDTQSS